MKISIIGGGNVGSLAALRLAQENIGDIMLIDIVKGLAQGKAYDLEDARSVLKNNYHVEGSNQIENINGSDIVVVTAGLARKPGMTREELLSKNALILRDICLNIKKYAAGSIVIIVTNPLDLMTYFALKVTGFDSKKLFGMGLSLDGSRFANLISKELHHPITDIEACVIGSHGEGMLPLARFTKIKGTRLTEFLDTTKIQNLVNKTILRGAEIVGLLGSGSAYFAPSAAISELVKAVAGNQNKTIGVCAYLNGEYGIKNLCIGVPCIINKNGIEKIVDLGLSLEETEALRKSADSIRANIGFLNQFIPNEL